MFTKSMAIKGAIAAGLVEAGNILHIVGNTDSGEFLIVTREGADIPVEGFQSVQAGTVNYGVRKGGE